MTWSGVLMPETIAGRRRKSAPRRRDVRWDGGACIKLAVIPRRSSAMTDYRTSGPRRYRRADHAPAAGHRSQRIAWLAVRLPGRRRLVARQLGARRAATGRRGDRARRRRTRRCCTPGRSRCETELADPELGFEPLLPADDRPLAERAEAMVDWCRGFLGGFGLAGAAAHAKLSDEAQEVLRDLATIAGSSFDFGNEDRGRGCADRGAGVRARRRDAAAHRVRRARPVRQRHGALIPGHVRVWPRWRSAATNSRAAAAS